MPDAKRDGFFIGIAMALEVLIVGYDQPTIADSLLRDLKGDLPAFAQYIKRDETIPKVRKYVSAFAREEKANA